MPTFEEVVNKAKSLPAAEYLAWCNTIDFIESAYSFTELLGCTSGDSTLPHVLIEGKKNYLSTLMPDSGFWPSFPPNIRNNRVIVGQEPGAYVDIYDVIAVNTNSNKIWGICQVQSCGGPGQPDFEHKPLLPLATAEAVLAALISIPEMPEPELPFEYVNYLHRPLRFGVKDVISITFPVNEHKTHTIVFPEPMFEAKAVREAEKYLSAPITREYFDEFNDTNLIWGQITDLFDGKIRAITLESHPPGQQRLRYDILREIECVGGAITLKTSCNYD